MLDNWEYILLVFYVLEKLVKMSPATWDDILVDGLKSIAMKIVGKTAK